MSARTRPWFLRRRLTIPAGVFLVITGLIVWALLSVWPSSMAIRWVFAKGADATIAEMNKHQPPAGSVDERLDLSYGDGGDDTTLDLFRPAADDGALPVVVWIHGGAWISGDKRDVAPYLRILAAEGYAAIGLNYAVGPEGEYPLAVTQLNDALAAIVERAEEYGIDPERIVLAGDSAGAQLASQLTALTVNPGYAGNAGIAPALEPAQLSGLILNCGVYDLDAMTDLTGIIGWGFKTALWAYTGDRDWASTAAGNQMSTINAVTGDFPATFISGGNADGLTALHSEPMAERLADAGVDVTPLFWPKDYPGQLEHEYQFHLDLPEARRALQDTLVFLGDVTT